MHGRPYLLYVLGIAFFCAMDAAMKALIATNAVLMVTFWRYVVAVGFTGLIWLGSGRPAIHREMLPVHLLRGAFIAVSAFLFFWSFRRLTLAEAVTFSFIAPLLVPPIAAVVLKERVERGSLLAGALGFAGVLVATGLGTSALTPARLEGIAAVLVAALAYAVSMVLMRARAARDGAAIVSFLGAIAPMLVLAPFLVLLPAADRWPRPADALLFGVAGLMGAVALQCLARAFAQAQAQRLAPFEYTALGWAALFGWALFAEPVAPRTLAGAAIIAAACLWQARRS